MRIYLTSLGCKLNQAEFEALAREIERRGHAVVADPLDADWAVINTCAVTHIAGRRSRQLARHLCRLKPELQVALTGCYASAEREVVREIEGVRLIVSNADKDALLSLILASSTTGDRVVPASARRGRLPLGHTRALVKIQDGCANDCAYCIVPSLRGVQRSRLPTRIVDEVRERCAEGYQEVVLTGVNIGAYGHDHPTLGPLPHSSGWSLARLVSLLLDETPIHRLRLSSIEPWYLQRELVTLWTNPRLCRHAHLPLQSGCDATLLRMGRKTDTRVFAEWVGRLRQAVPEMAITTDIIVGFPGEDDAEFAASVAFVEETRFSRLHVFRYSPRPGTAACTMPHQVPVSVAQERSEGMIGLGRRLALEYHRQFVGRELVVLAERSSLQRSRTIWSGLTDNYLRVRFPSDVDMANCLVTVCCSMADGEGLRGEVVDRQK